MSASLPLAAAFEVGRPLFGNQWLALLAALGFIAGLLAFVALVGRLLAATHPPSPPKVPPQTSSVGPVSLIGAGATASLPALIGEVPPEMVPVIFAAVTAYFGARCRVTTIQRVATPTNPAPSLEALMQQWSFEGRRHIYSSHKVR
jgi:hypothetical protein